MESVTEESIVGVKNEVDYIICSREIEAVTIPIDCHISRAHGIKHVVLEFLESVGLDCHLAGVFDFHALTIHGLGCCAYFVCHLSHRPPAADQFVLIRRGKFNLYDLTSVIVI